MRLIRFVQGDAVRYGRLEGENVRPLASLPWEDLTASGPSLPLAAVTLKAPVRPGKIIAVGLNYRDHAKETGMPLPEEPLLFSKASSSVIGPGEGIIVPDWTGRVDYEAELAVVIGRRARKVAVEEAADYILGLTCLNDVTARVLQKKDGQFTRAKGFDTFCPIGPWIETSLDWSDLTVRAEVNGRLVQDGRTRDMVFPVPELVAFITRVMTMEPGDVIATGTPAGIGPLSPGDEVTIEVEGIGRLTNPVLADADIV